MQAFNPPQNMNVVSTIATKFLKLIDHKFPHSHKNIRSSKETLIKFATFASKLSKNNNTPHKENP